MPDTDNNTEEIRRFVAQWLLEDNRRTAVADFQRPYTWSESHVTAFTESLLDSLFRPEKGSPDIGVVVIEETSDTDFIVDGQQRLLTFALLIVEWYPKGRETSTQFIRKECSFPQKPREIGAKFYSFNGCMCYNIYTH